MAFIPAPGIVRSEFLMSLGGQQIENVIHHDGHAGPYTPTVLAAINTTLIGWWGTTLAPLLSNNVTLRAVRTTDLTTASGAVVETAPGSTTAGGVAEIALPNNVAAVVTHRTAQRGRSFRGRSYIPGLPSGDEDTSTDATLSEIASLVASFVTLASILSTFGTDLGVLSNFSGGAPRTTGLFTKYTSHDANSAFDSQRRRLLGRGN